MMPGRNSIDSVLARRGLPMQVPASRPRLLPRVVAATARQLAARREPLSFTPVEADGTQPGFRMPFFSPLPSGPFNVLGAVAAIHAGRGVGPEKPCPFPDDLGCETQLYLALALLRIEPDLSLADLAGLCLVPVPDAVFFGTLVETARRGTWVKTEILHAACAALQRPMEGAP